MTSKTFRKILSANDVGTTGSHMGGILIPKAERELLAFLPPLDAKVLNPSAWIDCVTDQGENLRLRFVYYNNRMHAPNGTRNEYRITYMTGYLRQTGAKEGDTFEITRMDGNTNYSIRVVAKQIEGPVETDDGPVRIKLSGWRRVH